MQVCQMISKAEVIYLQCNHIDIESDYATANIKHSQSVLQLRDKTSTTHNQNTVRYEF